MKKRFVTTLLSLSLAMTMATPAFAAELTPAGDSSKDVTATYNTAADEVTHSYYATVDWTVPSFTYTFQGGAYTWSADKLAYEKTGTTGTAAWDTESKTVTLKVTNKSDQPINCDATLTKNIAQADAFSILYTKANESATTAAAAVTIEEGKYYGDYTAENSGTATVCDLSGTIAVSGAPNKSDKKLATITVTLSHD